MPRRKRSNRKDESSHSSSTPSSGNRRLQLLRKPLFSITVLERSFGHGKELLKSRAEEEVARQLDQVAVVALRASDEERPNRDR